MISQRVFVDFSLMFPCVYHEFLDREKKSYDPEDGFGGPPDPQKDPKINLMTFTDTPSLGREYVSMGGSPSHKPKP